MNRYPAILGMERKVLAVNPKDCPQGIGSQGIKTWVVQQTLHAFECIRPWHGCLHGEPGIQNHRFGLPTSLECLGGLGPLLTKDRLKGPQPGPRQRHGWPGHGLEGLLPCHGITRCRQPAPCHGRELALTLPLRPCRVPSQSRTGQQTGQRFTKRRTKTLPQRETARNRAGGSTGDCSDSSSARPGMDSRDASSDSSPGAMPSILC